MKNPIPNCRERKNNDLHRIYLLGILAPHQILDTLPKFRDHYEEKMMADSSVLIRRLRMNAMRGNLNPNIRD